MDFLLFIVNYFNITLKDWNSRKRSVPIRKAKEMSSGLLEELGYNPREIGDEIGKERTTVIHHLNSFKNELSLNPEYEKEYREFKERAEKYLNNTKERKINNLTIEKNVEHNNSKDLKDKIISDLLRENNELKKKLEESESKAQTLKSLYK